MRRFIIAAALLCAAGSAYADLVLKSSDESQELRLYESLCSHGETLSHIPQEFRDRFKNARIMDPRGTIIHYGCFASNEELALVVFEDGSRTLLELSKFKETTI